MAYRHSRQFDVAGKVITLQWFRINPQSSAENALYNLFVMEDGSEIDSETTIGMDEVTREVRLWQRRAREGR